ncbi:hypothetical protein FRZ67_08060 [Panacibacter ginsenosidivorans]|uniref:Uncharacterized protein n=1 Tax=Panacibacter ginsenosidivorans TaxID=1813871 RepID=A0A5B8V6Y5_9BACT|nr:hypothetical protein [Panacibacter ginsenosidivorans]QEC67250.1 hypothetical protein FRZ67_08060 [Panacibacter ginsenosidivorans]
MDNKIEFRNLELIKSGLKISVWKCSVDFFIKRLNKLENSTAISQKPYFIRPTYTNAPFNSNVTTGLIVLLNDENVREYVAILEMEVMLSRNDEPIKEANDLWLLNQYALSIFESQIKQNGIVDKNENLIIVPIVEFSQIDFQDWIR